MITAPILVAAAAVLAFAIAGWFRDLRVEWRGGALPAIVTGAAAAIAHIAFRDSDRGEWALPIILVVGSVLLRWRHVDEDYVDGTMSGMLAGAIAATITAPAEGPSFAATAVVQGAVAGLATHIVLFRVRVLGAVAGVAAAFVLVLAHDHLVELLEPLETRAPLVVIGVTLLLSLIATIIQLRLLRPEFMQESELGVATDDVAREMSHPWRRLTMRGWSDRKARHHFVRISRELATRKRRQRRMPAAAARLYQLEVIKLRQLLQEIYAVELSVRESKRAAARTEPSDRMDAERVTNIE